MTIVDVIRKKTVDMVLILAERNNIDFKAIKAQVVERSQKTFPDRAVKIIETMKSEAKQADFMGGLEHNKLHALPKQVAMVTLNHECLKYAHELLELPFPESEVLNRK